MKASSTSDCMSDARSPATAAPPAQPAHTCHSHSAHRSPCSPPTKRPHALQKCDGRKTQSSQGCPLGQAMLGCWWWWPL